MSVVADVNADPRECSVEARVSEVAGAKIEFLPKTRCYVRNMCLAIFAKIRTVRVDNGGGIVVNARLFFFVDRNDDHHAVLLGDLLHQLNGRPIGYLLDRFIPARLLLRAEIRRREYLL